MWHVPREDARGAQDASELDEAQETQHADRREYGGVGDARRVYEHHGVVDRDDGDYVESKPSLQVVAGDGAVVLDDAASLLDALPVREEEIEADVHHEDQVDDPVHHEERREPRVDRIIEFGLLPQEAHLVRCNCRRVKERREGKKVPVPANVSAYPDLA